MKKFYEFYFIDDNYVYNDDEYWRLYDENKEKAIKKFEGKMFCPLCLKAPLTVARGDKRKYFKVNSVDMHSINCSYRLDEANKSEVKSYYENLDIDDIKSKLTSCMNQLLNKAFKGFKNTKCIDDVRKSINEGIFSFKTRKAKIKHLPHMNLESRKIRENMDKIKIYYGECYVYFSKSPFSNSKGVYGGLLHILSLRTKKQICSISISPNVHEYLGIDFNNTVSQAEKYYLCFVSEMIMDNKGYLNCKINDSRLMLFEK